MLWEIESGFCPTSLQHQIFHSCSRSYHLWEHIMADGLLIENIINLFSISTFGKDNSQSSKSNTIKNRCHTLQKVDHKIIYKHPDASYIEVQMKNTFLISDDIVLVLISIHRLVIIQSTMSKKVYEHIPSHFPTIILN